jgi:PTH1 family peptidyl-tRNA hydrolase
VIPSPRKLIIGLGNPGEHYRATRHNAGFQAVEKFARQKGFIFKAHRSFKSFIAEGKIQGQAVSLMLPQTFMNLSGEAVLPYSKKKKIALTNILVVYDDAELPLGALKVKAKGSDGGHNGLASIIEKLGTRDVARLRLGIGRDGTRDELSDYVLSVFSKEERPEFAKVLERAVEAMSVWIYEGIDRCMNRFNTR